MKKVFALLTVLSVIGLSGFMMAGACEDVAAVCGDCGTVANGDATISGNAELDGIFKAVGTLKASTGSIQANFDSHVRVIAESVLGIEGVADMSTSEVVAAITADTGFKAWIDANVEGGLKVNYQPPKCSANVNVAVSAQAQCEAKADCNVDVECDPGQMSFECSGKCEGSCSMECSAPTCTVKLEAAAECSGECKGSCTVEVDGSVGCDGKCQGECSGECSAYDGEGNCNGSCSGNCTGSCVAEGSAAASCSGSCSGECKMEGTAEAECTGTFGCSGECSGECSGGCEGEVKAPKCEGNAECDASAKCEAQASAQASASLECTPPSIGIDFAFSADVSGDADAKAAFMAKLDIFKGEMVAIVQGWAQLRALVDADYAAEIGVKSPVVSITESVQGFITAIGNGDVEFEAEGLALCALPAFQESADILGSIVGDMSATLEGQVSMVGMLNIN